METMPLTSSLPATAGEAQWLAGLLSEAQSEATDDPGDPEFAAALLASLPAALPQAGETLPASIWADMPAEADLARLLGNEALVPEGAAKETPAPAVGLQPVLPPDQMIWLPTTESAAVDAAAGASSGNESAVEAPAIAVMAEVESIANGMAADTAEQAVADSTPRRVRPGLRIYADAFPPGWETLLEENPPAKPAAQNPVMPEVQSARESGGAAVEAAEPPAPARESFKTYASPKAEEGKNFERMPAAAAGADAESKTRAENGQTRAITPSDPEPAPNDDAMEVNTAWKTEVTVSGRAAGREAAASPVQTLSRLSELEKQLSIREFTTQTAAGIRRGEERISVDLHPPELGRVRVVVESRGEQVHAQLTLQDAGVGEFFQDRLEGIRRQLSEAGIKLGQLTVEVRQQFASGTQNGSGSREQDYSAAEERVPAPAARTAARPARLAPGQKVNMLM
ncbi:MAG: flagellar hook-length control protein FliK [candidate division FCPU426 bacterium]